VNGILLLILLRRKVLNDLFEMAFDFQSTDSTTNSNVKEGLSLEDEALFILFESADGCISAEAFNAVFAELICFVEVTSSHTNDAKVLHDILVVKVTVSHTNNAKTLHETFIDKVTDSNPV
jgi:hypothetical protein